MEQKSTTLSRIKRQNVSLETVRAAQRDGFPFLPGVVAVFSPLTEAVMRRGQCRHESATSGSLEEVRASPKSGVGRQVQRLRSVNKAGHWAAAARPGQTPSVSRRSPRDADKGVMLTQAQDEALAHICTRHKNSGHLRFAVLLDPAENTGRQLLETADWDRTAEGLKQRIHDALKDAELDLVRHLVLSWLWIVLVGLDYVFIVPIRRCGPLHRTQKTVRLWFLIHAQLPGIKFSLTFSWSLRPSLLSSGQKLPLLVSFSLYEENGCSRLLPTQNKQDSASQLLGGISFCLPQDASTQESLRHHPHAAMLWHFHLRYSWLWLQWKWGFPPQEWQGPRDVRMAQQQMEAGFSSSAGPP